MPPTLQEGAEFGLAAPPLRVRVLAQKCIVDLNISQQQADRKGAAPDGETDQFSRRIGFLIRNVGTTPLELAAYVRHASRRCSQEGM